MSIEQFYTNRALDSTRRDSPAERHLLVFSRALPYNIYFASFVVINQSYYFARRHHMSEAKKIVVIGGSAAGPKAAAKARRMDHHADITIIEAGPDLSMASCGYPYYVGGTFDDRNMLVSTPTGVTRDPRFFMNAKGIKALTETKVTAIDRKAHTVTALDLKTNKETAFKYDKLVIATGSTPTVPPVPGKDLNGVTCLKSMKDADYLRKVRDEGKVKKAVVVGAGLIGMETCEALHLAGISITLVEMLPQILPFLDWELAKLVENYVRKSVANVITENPVAAFLGTNGTLTAVKLRNGTELPCQLAVVAIGVRPNSQLAKDAGLEIGTTGGIKVNKYMQTTDPDIYAAGDCCELPHLISGRPVFAPFGDMANLEGRVIGQNVTIGNKAVFPGTNVTGICKIFDWEVGSTGLPEAKAADSGFNNTTSVMTVLPDKPGFMGSKPLVLKMLADNDTGRVLGLQCVGPGDVSKRIAAAAMAICGKLTVGDLVNADLPYAPPFSQALDALITTAHVLENKMLGRMKSLSSVEVKAKIDRGDDILFLDVRGPDEFEQMRLGIRETLIPLGSLRGRLKELPADKTKEIICFCKISLRGYEAASFLEAHGYTNAKVLEGGVLGWPYQREK